MATRHLGRGSGWSYYDMPEAYDDADVPVDMEINSVHHQACIWDSWEPKGSSSRSPLLLMTGQSDGQTAVEAWCNPDRGNLGFQWHPEWMAEDSVAYQWAQRVIKVFAFGDEDASGSPAGFCTVPSHVYQHQQYRVDLPDEVRNQCHTEFPSQ